jgi:hypothetical protein
MSSSAAYVAELVWVSSRDHLANFGMVLEATPWYRKLMGRIDTPVGFPQVVMGSRVFPVVYIARGRLAVEDKEINFQVRKDDNVDLKSLPKIALATMPATSYRNLDKSLSFAANPAEVAILGRFQAKQGRSYYAINWVEMKVPSIQHPVLLCVGGNGPSMSRIRQETDRLLEEIRSRQTRR